MDTDRIEKHVVLKASLERVWQALADARQFGQWFGASFDQPFVAGRTLRATIVPTTVDAAVAAMQKPHAGLTFEFTVERIEPMACIAFRWHPFAIDPLHDYSKEPTTLIEFVLQPKADGVVLTISESGFDQIPLARRMQAFAANDVGWAMQATLISKYLALHAKD